MSKIDGFLSWIGELDHAEQERLIRALSPEEARFAAGHWESWAHEGQRAPEGDWRSWVIKAGRGFGKTLAGSQWILSAVRSGAPLRIALVGATLDEARRVMVEGRSGLIAVAGELVSDWHPTRRLLRFATGAEATLFSGASPEALRGPEHHLAWCDELAKWALPDACWDMLQLGLRLAHPETGAPPRAIVTTTPRPGATLRRIMEAPGCVVTGGASRANPHLPPAFLNAVEALYGGTRLGRQELDGELLTDSAGALWTVELLERCRIRAEGVDPGRSVRAEPEGQADRLSGRDRSEGDGGASSPPYGRTLVGVDPPAGDGTCGIVACARDAQGRAHVLADHSVSGRSPEGWARAVAHAAAIHGADAVIAEANQGGRMVEAVLRTADPAMRVRLVNARAGKTLRAEPVAHLFEAGRVLLHGRFPELEAELTGMIAGGDYEGPGRSPDRADAMVWGLTELMLGKEPPEARVRMF